MNKSATFAVMISCSQLVSCGTDVYNLDDLKVMDMDDYKKEVGNNYIYPECKKIFLKLRKDGFFVGKNDKEIYFFAKGFMDFVNEVVDHSCARDPLSSKEYGDGILASLKVFGPQKKKSLIFNDWK